MFTVARLSSSVLQVLIGGLLAACAVSAAPGADRFTGFITRVGEDTLDVSTRPGTSRVIHTTGSTRYLKWVTHQPWQQPTGADRTFLQVERCVQVQLQAGEPSIAQT